VLPTRHHTPTDNDVKIKKKLFPTLIIHYLQFKFLQFYTGIDTTVQNNDNEILLYFKSTELIFMNYSI
jgi:hypothetical protein